MAYLINRYLIKIALSKDTALTEAQKRIIDKLEKNDSLLVYHGMGTGKTLAALAAGEKLNIPVSVVAPASVVGHFENERKKHDVNVGLKASSYNKPLRDAANKLLVFDESQRMGRLESKRSHLVDEIVGKKKLFMTGTPIRNDPSELIPILRGLGLDIPRDKKKFYDTYIQETKKHPGLFGWLMGAKPGIEYSIKNESKLRKMLKNKVDYVEPSKEKFPDVVEEDIIVNMTKPQYKIYRGLLNRNPALAYKVRRNLPPSKTESKQLNAFLSAVRQVSNTPIEFTKKEVSLSDEPKIERAKTEIIKRFKSDPNYRGITYSHYLGSGIKRLSERLSKENVPVELFTGELTRKQREEIINKFNKGDIKHLLISGAGGEGIDLRGTKLVQVLEPHWNDPTIEQVVARAIRYKSHEHLPKSERSVTVQKYYARPPKRFLRKKEIGVDEYLKMLSSKKTELNEQFLNVLRDIGRQ